MRLPNIDLVLFAQIDFVNYSIEFEKSKVDGDILLQLDESSLAQDIGIKNSLLRMRFMRELSLLKQITDYTSCDSSKLHSVLSGLGPEYTQYTYPMIKAGITMRLLPAITEDMLVSDCHIGNSVHRMRILDAVRSECPSPKCLFWLQAYSIPQITSIQERERIRAKTISMHSSATDDPMVHIWPGKCIQVRCLNNSI